MKNKLLLFIILSFAGINGLHSEQSSDTLVYLITCSPGTATYSIYGHSALRVQIHSSGYDMVYNWGVFDFDTPHFVWKFAKGRLNYMLGVYPYELFLREYLTERRSVYSQKVNLEPEELKQLMDLLEENLKPENIYYRYDFFYDNCSTRIRDLFEKIFSGRLIYPPDNKRGLPTFREKINEYQEKYPWLNAGINFVLGLPADKKASFRDIMFLPEELQHNLTLTEIKKDGKRIPLLQPVETVFEFEPLQIQKPFYLSPMFVLSVVFIFVLALSIWLRENFLINYFDILIFAIFSLLSLLLIFFNFITDHQQTRMNLNMIWINPFIIVCLICIAFNKQGIIWFRLVFWLSVFFIALSVVFTSKINGEFIPAALILTLRSSARSAFIWCPYNINGFFP